MPQSQRSLAAILAVSLVRMSLVRAAFSALTNRDHATDGSLMHNFGRALKLVLRHRWTLVGTLASALIVALLWGANIGGMYPVIQVIFGGQSLQKWVNEAIADSTKRIVDFDGQIDRQEKALADAPEAGRREMQVALSGLRSARDIEQKTLLGRQHLKPYIDRYLPDDPFRTLILIVGVLMVATLFKNLCMVLNSIWVDRLTFMTTLELRKQFYRRTLRMDLAGFGQNSSSELMSRFTYDLDSVGGGVQVLMGRAIREPLKMVACLVGAAWICWRLLLVSLLVAPLAAFLIGRLSKALKRANRRAMEEMSQLYTILQETFGGIKIVKAFTMERYERRRLHENSKELYRKAMKISRYDALGHPMVEAMGVAMICLGILSGAYLVLNQETRLLGIKMCDRPLDLAGLLVFYGMLVGASDPARKMSEVFNRLQRGAAAADRVYELLDREPTIRNPLKAVLLPRHSRELTFENIHFSYKPGQTVLDGLDLRIPFGETMAIVGPNGCGKTTLANLVPRFFDPTSGTIRLDGTPIANARLVDLRRQIGIVTQEPVLFDDTVFNNIRYGQPDATRQQVIEAAKQAHAHRFIENRLEHGYDTVVGQLGGRLSGGERQRIALARAILRDPAILILDEATSQIDLESEQLIHKALEQFTRGRTTIIITHRLATLDLADRIMVMQAGKCIDVGTHAELISRCEFYRRLYQIQFREIA
ncbi:MAG TPA: ABC transporter ATP-binding protein [Pirellulales bacterium]|nr:ABC transporter ATP-binding protein [Pirellulales bacterium]